MRKILPVMIGVFFTVALCIYGITWYVQAGKAEEKVIEIISRANADQKWITYESLSKGGFPARVSITLHKLQLNGRADTLLKALATQIPATPDGTEASELKKALLSLPEWTEKLSYGGDITVSVTPFSNRFMLDIGGDIKSESTIGGDKVRTLTQPKSPFHCELLFRASAGDVMGTLWDLERPFQSAQSFKEDFQSIRCTSEGYSMKNMDTGAPLAESKGAAFSISIAPAEAGVNANLTFTMQETEAFPAMDDYIARYAKILQPDLPLSPNLSISKYGKQTMDFAGSWQGPSDPKQLSRRTPFNLHINKCAIKNALYNSDTSLHLDNNVIQPNVVKSTIQLKSASDVTPSYDALLKDMLRVSIERLYTSNDPQVLPLQTILEGFSQEHMVKLLTPLIPQLSTFGRINVAVDGMRQGDPAMGVGDIALNHAELSFTPYGIQLNGKGKLTATSLPVGTLNLACRNCPALIDDANRWLKQAHTALSAFDAGLGKQFSFNHTEAERTKHFLATLGVIPKDNQELLTFAIVSDGTANITVNGKNLGEVIQLYTQSLPTQ